MKIEHTAIDSNSGANRVVLTGAGIEELAAGQVLRCAAYRFSIVEVERTFLGTTGNVDNSPSVVALIAGAHRPMLGMQVYLSSQPLSVEEVEAATRHLLMLPRFLLGIDASAIAASLAHALQQVGPDSANRNTQIRTAATVLQKIAELAGEATFRLPSGAHLDEAQRYQAELADLAHG